MDARSWNVTNLCRAAAILVLHVLAFTLAYWAAYALRFEFQIYDYYLRIFWTTLPAIVAIKVAVFYGLGHGRQSWRHLTFSDLSSLLRATTLSSLLIVAGNRLASHYNIPRSIYITDWVLTVLILGGIRAVWRLSREELRTIVLRRGARKAIIVGANATGDWLARQLLYENRFNFLVVGFLDTQRSLHGTWLGGVQVLGAPEDVVRFADDLEVTSVLVISGALSGPRLRRLMDCCKAVGLDLKVIPAVDDLLTSDYVMQIRDVDINDLLRREPVRLNDDAIRQRMKGRSIMVTGAGGSIGSEICRQLLKYRPRRLLLVERCENSLFLIEQELTGRKSSVEFRACLADVADRGRMEYLMREYQPQIVFHAAAHKHVPMVERNPGEAIKNNVVGTMQLAELSDQFGVEEFVLISTDKSVNPTSIMGLSKQLAERFVHAFSDVAATRFVVVRFGNVLASAGSVVPIFQEQIRQGGPITVTHPDIERYFMTIPEASQLVLQAAVMGSGGEIFVLDMGQPVKIVSLAHDLVRLSRLSPDDIEIVFTGLRPGEKLYEELYFDDEQRLPTPHPKLFVAYHRPCELEEVRRWIGELSRLADHPPEILRAKIKELIPEFDAATSTPAHTEPALPASDSPPA